ncbi:MAG TPA: hypothetical protein V6D47_00620 [Oscillatoriaceae cyanobacterium]
MDSLRLNRSTPVQSALPAKPLASTPAPAPAAQASDSLQLSKSNSNADALGVIDQASALPPMPSDADAQKAWLNDGFSRLLKANAAQQSLEDAWGKGQLDGGSFNAACLKVDALQQALQQSPQYDAVKQSFFAGLVGPAQQMLGSLKAFPAPPADKAGQQKWLAQAKQKLAQAQAANQVLNDAWFRFHALSFDDQAKGSDQLFDFQSRIDDVDYALHPPKPSKATSSGTDSWTPMQNTSAIANAMNKHPNPVTETVGAVVLPIAMTVDVIDLLTKPFQLLSGNGGKAR